MTLRVPSAEMVSTMTLRFGSSWRRTKMPAPPMPSRRFSTTCLCSSTKACRSSMRRATREGTVNCGNSAIENFSLWSRTASGALNTFAPWRSACDRSQLLATYSMSNGGSFRMSTAPNSASGRSTSSWVLYQSSSSSLSERRVARAATELFAQSSALCSQTKTACPRAWAARIIATVVSLFALSSSGGSMTKRRFRLLALRDHEFDPRAELRIRERGHPGLRGHRAFAVGHGLHQRGHALLNARRPRRLVAELRSSCYTRGVTDVAHLVIDRLAVCRRGSGLGLCSRRGRGCRLRRGGCSLRLLLRRCGFGGLLRRGRLLQLSARLIGHEDDGARDLVVGQRGVAAAGRHRAFAFERNRQHALQSILEPRPPRLRSAVLRRARHTGRVAGAAGGLHDGLAGTRARGRRRSAEFNPGHGPDARRHGIGCQRIGIRARAVRHELHDQDNSQDRHEEREHDRNDELLRSLDEGGVRVVHGHGRGSLVL